MRTLSLLTAALLGVAGIAHAQQPPPSAGALVQQIPPPAQRESQSRIDLVEPRAEEVREPVTDGARVPVSALRVTGASVFSEAELIAETGVVAGSALTLAELRNAAAAITTSTPATAISWPAPICPRRTSAPASSP